MTTRISNVDTLADLIDRLIVEVNKLSWLEAKKRDEQAKEDKDEQLIAYWDRLSRSCCNLRAALKNEINRVFKEVVSTGEYLYLPEVKTFGPPKRRLVDALDDRCQDIGDMFIREEIKELIQRDLQVAEDEVSFDS